ncbi:hypothetical protein EYE35_00250 [Cereibacter sphaeroides]|nr:hypothetical protein EYE35_00250 [Cereibacter sphaeroides]
MIRFARIPLSLAAALICAAPLLPSAAWSQTGAPRPFVSAGDRPVPLPWTRPVMPGEGHDRPAAWGRIYPPPQEIPVPRHRAEGPRPAHGDHRPWDDRRAWADWRRWSEHHDRGPRREGPPRPALRDLPRECLIVTRSGRAAFDAGCLARNGFRS